MSSPELRGLKQDRFRRGSGPACRAPCSFLLALRKLRDREERLRRFQLLRLLQSFLGHFVLPSLICPAELRSTHMQRGRQTPRFHRLTASYSECGT